jgi:hypothetical protein
MPEATAFGLSPLPGTPAVPGAVGVDVRSAPYFARCDGTTDDTAAVQAAANANAAITFPIGTCVVSNLTLTRDVQMSGCGPGSILLQKAGATGWLVDASSHQFRASNIAIDGGLNSTQIATGSPGTRSGVQMTSTIRNSGLFNSIIRGFSNIAVGLAGTASFVAGTPAISNCNICFSYIGIETRVGSSGTAAEYSNIVGCHVTDNAFGINIHSGNTRVVGNNVTANGVNLQILADTNSGKGSIVGNSFNHAGTYALYASGTGNGYVISGNQFQLGDMYTELQLDGTTLSLNKNSSGAIAGYLPTADPHVVGQWWNNSGVVTVSAG